MFPSFKEAPTTASALFSAYASVAASMMLVRSMANEVIPYELRSYLTSAVRYLFTPLSSDLTLVVEEFSGMARNQVFDAAELYLRSKVSPSTARLRVSKIPRQKAINVAIEKGEQVSDEFERIKLQWRFVCTEPKNNHSGEKRFFELTFHKRFKHRVLDSYLPYVLFRAKSIKQEERVIKLYNRECPYDEVEDGGSRGGGLWGSINLEHPATFETLAMDPDMKRRIIEDLDRFIRRKEFYKKVGKAWKRGYLLYGPPGTGKSSLIAAMANYLKFDIYDLELTSIYSNSELRRTLLATSNRSILVIEDIDCSVDLQNRQYEEGFEASNTKLTLSGLLNFIDGLWSSCGDERIIVFTTNHKDRLDPALLRPGRMDMHINMSYCTKDGFRTLASNYLGIHCNGHRLCEEIEGLISNTEVTPAEVAEELMKSDDADVALDELVNFLKRKKIESIEKKEEAQQEQEQEQKIVEPPKSKRIKLTDGALSEGSRVLIEFRDQFETLQKELLLMQSFLKDAERIKRKNKNQILSRFMVDLRELIYQAEDMLADCELQSMDNDSGWLMCFNPSRLPFQYQTGKRLEEMNRKISNIKTNISTYLGVPLLTQPGGDPHNDQIPRWSTPVYDHTQVVGLEGDTRKLKEWLLESDKEILAIGVVGMGGLGKTTIAQKVFNDREMEDHFERRIWVSVSQTFTEEQIMRSMLRNLGDASTGDTAGELLKKINQYLLGKRFLIVMDDVWEGDLSWWHRIYGGLPKGNGSGVIITTRITEVAQKMSVKETRMHRPKCLSKDNSWLLFRKVAFAAEGGECKYRELEDVGEEIVEKCRGLPLAIKAVGGIMLCKPARYPEWKRIVDHFRDELAENDNSVMASLQLSYDELPSYLKSCFLCLSVYPEDCVITKDQLVHWWIGEGFVPLRCGRSATEAGEDCFTGLTNRCLLEVVDKTYYGTIDTCKTHDMVRDLVIGIAKEDAFLGKDVSNSRHLSIDTPMAREQMIANAKLRALLSTTKSGEVNRIASNIARKFCESRYLRAIDLSRSIFETPLSGLLRNVGYLQHLTYLSVNNTHPLVQLPPSLEKLHNLQILDVSYCQNLKSLPTYIVTFKKLRILDVNHCGSLESLPKGLGRLSQLEVLLGFKPAKSNQPEGCRIGELRNLMKLRKLGLQLTRGDEIADTEVHAMVKLQELQHLSISCFDCHGDDIITKLDKFYPPEQLHELSLKFYPGKISPMWLNPISLPMLRYLSICSGNLSKMHQGFWGDDNTAVWRIEGMLLESLSDFEEEWLKVKQVMPSLRVVSASWCPELVSFPIEDIGFRGRVWKKEEQTN
ncbi:Spastin [Parasponia andersonii]|uniref:Spastin n=1 Tax=Parasponia andersonii TaxID=3476 RepID=A0A2P5DDV6_PARAD|nr:Spastin [Parasponia andersonii]